MICLELGSGSTGRPEPWITSDLNPQSGAKMVIDVTKPLPFDNDTVDYCYSEHMIEHITYDEGLFMLKECYRILKPGGVCRVVTPFIGFLMDLVSWKKDSSFVQSYLRWAAFAFGLNPNNTETIRARVFNNFVRAWGHQFIYDKATMEDSMLRAGFDLGNLAWPTPIGFSNHTMLNGLETVNRLPAGFLEFESMIVEGIK